MKTILVQDRKARRGQRCMWQAFDEDVEYIASSPAHDGQFYRMGICGRCGAVDPDYDVVEKKNN